MTFRSARGPTRRGPTQRHVIYGAVAGPASAGPASAGPGSDAPAGDELALLYARYSRWLLQLAALLVPDLAAAREIMYEAFAALDREGTRRSGDELTFLLRAIVRRARKASPSPHDSEGGVLAVLRALPAAQREALVFRYYGQLSDERAAAAIGVRPAELRANVADGLAALRSALAWPGHSPPGPPPGHS